ncbi:unnamed protein product [Cylicostephanus goldi]|uniref:PAZ domain-containing protein n=1 Tax=Cylicostephanus goldi TaxID=71465 RepID=A0A3P7Q258_CYLGO|nr:unnamed protein product [Cylicostephanus goldi]
MRINVRNIKVETIALPEKRTPGNLGAKTEFITNLTPLSLKPNIPFFKYDIRMYVVYKGADGQERLKELTKQTKDDFPEQERKTATVLVYKNLLKCHADMFPSDGALFYDRAAILFSAQKQIKLDGEEKTFNLPASVIPNGGTDAESIRVVIKKVTDGFQVTSNDLAKAVNVRELEKDKGLLEVLNIAMSQKGYLETSQFVTYGSGVHYLFDHRALGFRDNEVPELMDGKYMGIGVTKSVKVLQGEKGPNAPTAFVVTDITKGAFHIDDQNLLEKISSMSIFIDPRSGQSRFTVEAAMQIYNQKAILQIIKVELLTVAPSQRVTLQQQTPDQVATMIKACATLPQNRLSQTKILKDALNIKNGNPYLKAAGIDIANGFTKVRC